MFIVGKSFCSEILSKLDIKTIAPLCVIQCLQILNTSEYGWQKIFFRCFQWKNDTNYFLQPSFLICFIQFPKTPSTLFLFVQLHYTISYNFIIWWSKLIIYYICDLVVPHSDFSSLGIQISDMKSWHVRISHNV